MASDEPMNPRDVNVCAVAVVPRHPRRSHGDRARKPARDSLRLATGGEDLALHFRKAEHRVFGRDRMSVAGIGVIPLPTQNRSTARSRYRPHSHHAFPSSTLIG
jgi:hypothetical protein